MTREKAQSDPVADVFWAYQTMCLSRPALEHSRDAGIFTQGEYDSRIAEIDMLRNVLLERCKWFKLEDGRVMEWSTTQEIPAFSGIEVICKSDEKSDFFGLPLTIEEWKDFKACGDFWAMERIEYTQKAAESRESVKP
jgi:hypothetical protein